MPGPTAAERSLIGRANAHHSWAVTPDRWARTQPARDGLRARIERDLNLPDSLDPAERAKRVNSALRAHMLRLAALSATARRKAAGLAETADLAETELASLGGGAA